MNNPTNKTEPMPKWWWLKPWTFAIGQWEARERHYAKYLELCKAYAKTNIELFELKKQIKWQPICTAPTNRSILVSFYYPYESDKEVYFKITYWSDAEKGWDGMATSIRNKLIVPLHWTELPKPPQN